ncbi:MAG TPA: hypothetical protein DCZ92_02530 [Elusimicrobia bacterium]|nr:MAG: hypothetical protein A2016_11180 [Elusimicrobia bacterium GWF2_62_30]HBA59700.1 hypothetical protein [Elusimicrobiota bacterium]
MRNSFVNYATLGTAGLLLPVLLYFILDFFPRDAYTLTGIALIIPGFLLLAVARVQLGASFSVSAQTHKLVTTGLYSKLRHPIYYFGQFIVIGLVLCLHSPWLLLLWALTVAVQAYRIRKEEKVLEERFGEEYRAYKARTWF